MGFFSSASQVSRFVLHGLDVTEFKERLTAFSVQVIEDRAELKSMGGHNGQPTDRVLQARRHRCVAALCCG